jgi:hypothetical protein
MLTLSQRDRMLVENGIPTILPRPVGWAVKNSGVLFKICVPELSLYE